MDQLGGNDRGHSPPMSNHMTSILVNMNDRLNKGYGTDALTRIHGGENKT